MRPFCAPLIALAGVLVLAGCAASPEGRLAEARAAMAETDFDDAIAAATAGRAGTADDGATAWGLDLVLLEAHARAGHGEAAVAHLQSLTDRHPRRLPPSQYSATASQLKHAGDGASSVLALDMGMRRFPADDTLYQMIAASKKAAAVDNAQFQMLKSLGYVE